MPSVPFTLRKNGSLTAFNHYVTMPPPYYQGSNLVVCFQGFITKLSHKSYKQPHRPASPGAMRHFVITTHFMLTYAFCITIVRLINRVLKVAFRLLYYWSLSGDEVGQNARVNRHSPNHKLVCCFLCSQFSEFHSVPKFPSYV